MAKRYSKFHSNYILRKKHQETIKGTIWERDWVTIGAQHQLEKGKRVFYGDTNFLFTDNSFTSYKKRHKFSKWIGNWTYDDAEFTSSRETNVVEPNWVSNYLRDFAYYGSCVELIKNAVFNIVKWFPGRMTISSESLYVGEKYGEVIEVNSEGATVLPYTKGYKLNNPFGLDLYRNIYDQVTDENINRYVADSYYQYEINDEPIVNYSIKKLPTDCIGREIVKICQIAILSSSGTLYFIDGYDVFGEIIYVEAQSPYKQYYTKINENGEYGDIVPEQNEEYPDTVYIHYEDVDKVYVLVQDIVTEEGGETYKEVVIRTEWFPNASIYDYAEVIDGEQSGYLISIEEYEKLNKKDKNRYIPRYYLAISPEEYLNYDERLEDGTYFTINNLAGEMNSIKPFFGELGKIKTLQESPENVIAYIESLKGIERLLLNNKTNPLYRVTLKTPIETDNGYIYTEKFYTWPSTEGYIDVSSVMYDEYINGLINIATIFDDTWCDNLWRSMTHEAIRNFDWSYTKSYNEGDEEAFIEGGKRMMDVMHIYGSIVDELKRYIDGIKMTSIVTYDNYNNMPSAEMTDKLAYRGWDVCSIVPLFNRDGEIEEEKVNEYNFSTVKIDDGFVNSYIQKQQEFITEADYYNLPEESRINYAFNYIRVSNNTDYGEMYDAIGTNIIMAEDYVNIDEQDKYIPRYQNTIINSEDYELLPNEKKDKYSVYEYMKPSDEDGRIGNILLYTEYNSIKWQEDYMLTDSNRYCYRDGENCATPLNEITEAEYLKLRSGKDKYIPYTYRKIDEIYDVDCWVNINDDTTITNTEYENVEDKSAYVKPIPYTITYNGVEYPVSDFYPYTYSKGEETISFAEYNRREWCEDYVAFEYFIPTDVDNYQQEANADNSEVYTWETFYELTDEEKSQYRPYRYMNTLDRDSIITPEQYSKLDCKRNWTIEEYYNINDGDITITKEEYSNVSKYILFNVVSQLQYAQLDSKQRTYFAPYYPMRVLGFDKWFNARNVNAETMAEQDIRFAKELMLLSKQMFATKGTRQGIDMIMSMFGFADTYTLTEKYHFVDLKNHLYDDMKYGELQMAASYDENIYEESNLGGDEFPNNTVPLGTVELHGIDYIIPYYVNNKPYAGGEIYFQSNGGWGAKPYIGDNGLENYNYMETLSYLRIVETISDLLNVNARTVKDGDIYYVLSLIDIVEYDENPPSPEKLSHFFVLTDDFNPHLYSSWKNIDMNDDNDNAKTARYLDNIISTSVGNNPHTGYGEYDLGNRYLEYMKKPFKYYLDNYVLDEDIRDIMDGDDAKFTINTRETIEMNGKVKNVADCEKINANNIFDTPHIDNKKFIDNSEPEQEDISGEQYYLNDKTLIITNKLNNKLYKKYFFDVIVHYLMQMIPSTTILILENFNIDNDQP